MSEKLAAAICKRYGNSEWSSGSRKMSRRRSGKGSSKRSCSCSSRMNKEHKLATFFKAVCFAGHLRKQSRKHGFGSCLLRSPTSS